jgi:aryl-alcohol dehydrogenase-like predicted oxidoreductase
MVHLPSKNSTLIELLNQHRFKANPTRRSSIFLATKFANRYTPDMKTRIIDSSAKYTKEACAKSLSRLGLPYVDLYYCHRLDQKTPIEETVQAMVELKSEGKIKHLGLSECSSESLRRAHRVHPISAVQVEYSPFALDIESAQIDLLRTCRELGVAVVAYSPLGRGMLTGSLRSPDDFDESDYRKVAPRFSSENFPKNLGLVEQLSAVAKEKGVTSTQLVLSWLMSQGEDIFPIPGTTRLERLEENVGSLYVKLRAEEEQRIRAFCDGAEVCGTRYPESFMAACFADTPPL